MTTPSRLAECLERMAEAAFDLRPNDATRRGAEEIAGFIGHITRVPVERSDEPFALNIQEPDNADQD